jgi:hypothetical protein
MRIGVRRAPYGRRPHTPQCGAAETVETAEGPLPIRAGVGRGRTQVAAISRYLDTDGRAWPAGRRRKRIRTSALKVPDRRHGGLSGRAESPVSFRSIAGMQWSAIPLWHRWSPHSVGDVVAPALCYECRMYYARQITAREADVSQLVIGHQRQFRQHGAASPPFGQARQSFNQPPADATLVRRNARARRLVTLSYAELT